MKKEDRVKRLHFDEKIDELNQETDTLLDEIKHIKNDESEKEIEFSEKIDELNQETDSLLNEIEKWQM